MILARLAVLASLVSVAAPVAAEDAATAPPREWSVSIHPLELIPVELDGTRGYRVSAMGERRLADAFSLAVELGIRRRRGARSRPRCGPRPPRRAGTSSEASSAASPWPRR